MRKYSIKRTRRRRTRRQRGGQFSVKYSGIPVKGQRFTKEQTATKPQVYIPEGHYIVMTDPDATKPDWIHWIATPTYDILPYMGPSPPPGTGVHKYRIFLVAGNPPPAPKTRGGQITALLTPNPVASAEFTVSSENNRTL
jgi:phosphatidylethanolamine-binding protein (PEBP) family uncharacterized protein